MQVRHGITNGAQLLGIFIGNIDVEFLFEFHHQFHNVQRVGAEVFDEARFGRELLALHAELFFNDILDLRRLIRHGNDSSGWEK